MATTIAPGTLTTVENDETVNNDVSDLSHMCQDFQMMCSNHGDWGKLVEPAPLSICVLGDLMVVASSMADFPLNERLKVGGYEFMKHPASFRASLVQISNSGYQAFKLAHTKMDQIRLYTQSIPSTMKHVKQTLDSENTQAIAIMLPIQLDQLQVAAKRSATCSTEVVQSFEKVMNLVGEVLTEVMKSKGFKEDQQDDTRREQAVLKVVATDAELLTVKLSKDKEEADKKVEEAQKKLYEAMLNMSSGWKYTGMNITERIVNFFSRNFFSRARSSGGTKGPRDGTEEVRHSADVPEKVNLDKECLLKNRHNVQKIAGIANQLDEFVARDFKNMGSTIKSQFSAKNDISILTTIAQEALGCDKVAKLCQVGIDVMETLEGLLPSESSEDIKMANGKIQDFSKQVAELRETVNSMNYPDLGSTPSIPNVLQTSGSSSELAAGNARFQVLILQEHFKKALEEAEKARVRIEENNLEHLKALVSMERMKFSEMNHGDAIKLLKEGLANLARLQQYWSRLELFYSSVSNMVELSMKQNLSEFDRYIKGIVLSSTDLNLLKNRQILDIIHDSAKKASETSYFVHSMAETYTKVSAKYIMPNIAKLNQLIAFDAETAGMSIDQKRTELLESCARDSEAINKLVMDEKNALIIQIQKRKEYTSDQFPAPFNANEDGNLELENYIVEEVA